MKEALAAGRAEIRRRFENEAASGTQTVRAKAYLVDQMIRVVYDHADQRLYPPATTSPGERLSPAAVGPSGRGYTHTLSANDLLFRMPYNSPPRSAQGVEEISSRLWHNQGRATGREKADPD